jgi:prepilin-type N-terminal cleavage/methylation domain-containing protein
MRKGFTLAEVLITLGVIGVVAALTLPALIVNHKKKVILTRMKKFYSAYTQTYNMKIANDGSIDASMLTAINNPDVMMEFFSTNYAPYMNIAETRKGSKGIMAAFPDGSGVYLRKEGCTLQSTQCSYIIFCVDYKKCVNLDENQYVSSGMVDGKNTFLFWNGIALPDMNFDRDALKARCKSPANGQSNTCSTLIVHDGWQILDDYPIKF